MTKGESIQNIEMKFMHPFATPSLSTSIIQSARSSFASTWRQQAWLTAFLLLAFAASGLRAATPADENFDSYSGFGISGRIVGDWQFRLFDGAGNEDTGGGDFVDIIDVNETNVTALATGTDNALTLFGTSNVTVYAQIRATAGDPFSLVSFHVDTDTTNFTVIGYLGGNPVAGASQNFAAPPDVDTTVTLISAAWRNIDEFRIRRQDSVADFILFLDDINVSPAIPTSQAPVLGNLDGDNSTYFENAGPVLLDTGTAATLNDADSTNFTGGLIRVAITANRIPPQDVIGIQNQGTGAGQVGVSGNLVSYSGIPVGAFTGGQGTSDLEIALTNNATRVATEAILRALTYDNVNTNVPITPSRLVSIRLHDGDGGTAFVTVTVGVVLANNPPTITLSGGTTTFIDDANLPHTPVAVDPSLLIADLDDTTLSAGTVSIGATFVPAEDSLSFTNDGSTMGNITASYNATNGVLSLISAGATATLAEWTSALRAVAYLNTSVEPRAGVGDRGKHCLWCAGGGHFTVGVRSDDRS